MENPAAEPEPEADAPEPAVPDLDTTRPHMARIYDYFLGYFVATHITMEHATDAIAAGQRTLRTAGVPAQARDSDEFARLAFSGLDLVPPGVVLVSDWRPVGGGPRPAPSEVNVYGGVARKP
jgi:hypothetical protein